MFKKMLPFVFFVIVFAASMLACGGGGGGEPELVCPTGPGSCYNPALGAPAHDSNIPAPTNAPACTGAGCEQIGNGVDAFLQNALP